MYFDKYDKDLGRQGIEKPSWSNEPCRHPEHKPPRMIVYRPGQHTHKCPSCGQTTTFTVRDVTLSL